MTLALLLVPMVPLPGPSVGAPTPVQGVHLARAPDPSGPGTDRPSFDAAGSPVPLLPSNLTGNWSGLAFPPPGVGARAYAALSPDPDLGGVVLFGGATANNASAVGGTWLFKNGSWIDLGSGFANSPHARWAGALAWDPAADELVLFGGRNASVTFNDTWVLAAGNVTNGHGWSDLNLSTAPSRRAFTAAFYDPDRSSLIVYGGVCYRCSSVHANLTFNDTWALSSGSWGNVTPANGVHPDGLFSAYSAWDPDLGGGLLTGGATRGLGCTGTNTTWLYNGNWTELSTNATPGNLTQGQMVWYAPGHEMVLYAGLIAGGFGCTLAANSTWVLTGRSWSDLTAVSSASSTIGSRYGGGVAYDPFAHVVLVFGGATNNTTTLGDVWSFPAAPLEATITAGAIAAANGSPDHFGANVNGGQSPYYYHWTFGDGTPTVGGAVTKHVYAVPGVYVVSLEVVDDAGRTGNATANVTVVTPLAVTATSGPLHGDAPFYVTFNSSTGGGIAPYAWVWTFGDGFSWNSPNVTHEFMIEGTFHVWLNATDSIGDNATANFTAIVSGRMIISIVPSAYSALTPAVLNFSAGIKGGTSPFTYSWTFFPGAYATGPAPSFTFSSIGTYNVSLNVTDALGYVAQTAVTIHVYAPMTATCSAGAPAGVAPFTDSFSANTVGGAPPLYYSWDFGDGSPRVPGRTTSHEYYGAGHYSVELTVTDQLGELINTTTSVVVVALLAVQASSSVAQGPGPLSVVFSSAPSGGLAPFAFAWAYGDGGVGSGPNSSHTYDTPGHYTADAQVTDALGENASGTVAVFVYQALQVALAANPDSLTLGNVSTLTATVTGGVAPLTFSWTGLPPGCLSRNTTSIDCLPTASGTYAVEFHARDAVGQNRTANLSLPVLQPSGCACPSNPVGASGTLVEFTAVGVAITLAVAAAAFWVLRRRPGPPPDEGAPPTAP